MSNPPIIFTKKRVKPYFLRKNWNKRRFWLRIGRVFNWYIQGNFSLKRKFSRKNRQKIVKLKHPRTSRTLATKSDHFSFEIALNSFRSSTIQDLAIVSRVANTKGETAGNNPSFIRKQSKKTNFCGKWDQKHDKIVLVIKHEIHSRMGDTCFKNWSWECSIIKRFRVIWIIYCENNIFCVVVQVQLLEPWWRCWIDMLVVPRRSLEDK